MEASSSSIRFKFVQIMFPSGTPWGRATMGGSYMYVNIGRYREKSLEIFSKTIKPEKLKLV